MLEKVNPLTFFFWIQTIFKVYVEFVTILLVFYILFFYGPEDCGILAPLPGLEPAHPTLEGDVLTYVTT